MIYETKVVRQNMPSQTALPHVVPGLGQSMIDLIPPDNTGAWRYREMQVLKTDAYEAGYSVSARDYQVPPKHQPTMELLVIWERYKENL